MCWRSSAAALAGTSNTKVPSVARPPAVAWCAHICLPSGLRTAMDDLQDDEVLCTVPVYLSQELAQSLYVVQYPLRPVDRPYEDDLGACSHRCAARPNTRHCVPTDSSTGFRFLCPMQDNSPLRASSPKIKSSSLCTASIRTATISTRAPRASPSRSRSARAPCRRKQTMPSAFCAKAGLGKGVRVRIFGRQPCFFI